MRQVTIQYKPLRWLKFTRYHTGYFPSTWDDVNPKQLIAISCLLKNSISDIHFLSIMTNLSKRTIKKLDDYQRFQLIELFDSFHSNKPYNEFIIKSFVASNSKFIRPDPKLKNITFGQFIFMDTLFSNYLETSEQTDLNKFIAATYLPENTTFSENIIDANHRRIEKTDLITKEAIIINYHLIRDWLCESYPLVFQKQGESKTEEKTAKKRDPNSWIKIFDSIVADDIANQNKYADLTVHSVLRYLSNKIKINLKNR